MTIQTKGVNAVCSSIGDMEKHESFKKLNSITRLQVLKETYEKYGVKSNQFYKQVKPFIIWTIYRNLRGLSNEYLEDLVNVSYEEIILAFEGGKTTHYNREVYKEPYYNSTEFFEKYGAETFEDEMKNFGKFIMYFVGSAVSKYRSKYFRKKTMYEDDTNDISERINFTNFEQTNGLTYELDEPTIIQSFKRFEINESLAKHLKLLYRTKPRNNMLYNLLLWREYGEQQ